MGYVTNVPSTTITASWGNSEVRDQVVSQMPSAAARDSAITSPKNGTIVYLDDVDQYTRYKASTGWRRLDWLTSWGIVGGKDYGVSAVVLAAGVGTSPEAPLNADTGPVALIAGRRYRIEGRFSVVKSAAGEVELRVHDTNVLGQGRGYIHTPSLAAAVGYNVQIIGYYTCTSNETKTWLVGGNVFSGGGTFDFARTSSGTSLQVIDIGPAANLTTVP